MKYQNVKHRHSSAWVSSFVIKVLLINSARSVLKERNLPDEARKILKFKKAPKSVTQCGVETTKPRGNLVLEVFGQDHGHIPSTKYGA